MVLTFVEELMLLCLDDRTGELLPLSNVSVENAVAGALLMDLAFHGRVDSDPAHLRVVDPTPTGDDLLDDALAIVKAEAPEQSIETYLAAVARAGQAFRDRALGRLVERGVLMRAEGRFLWVFKTETYPVIDGKAVRNVKKRVISILTDDEIPDPRDVVLICLVWACDLLPHILSPEECRSVEGRVEQLRRLDLIGQSVGQAIRNIEWSLASVSGFV